MRHATSHHRIGFSFLVLQCLAVPAARAQKFEERHARDLAANPSDLSFRLSTVNADGRFQLGERIQIALEFSSSSREKYKLNGATYDRSGRLPTEEFVLERTDVADPYQDYFGTGVLGGLAGGLRGYPVLDSKPYTKLELNDWFRFDRPGVYHLYLKSHRLTRERAPGEAGEGTLQFAAVSNILEIEILPHDPGWETAKLAEITGILGQPEPELPKPGGPSVLVNPLSEKMAIAFSAYFVRVQPNDFGRDVLKRAMADRERRGCYRMLLTQIANIVWNPMLEEEAIAMLNDSDAEAAKSAATVLGSYGSPDVEVALWKRLEQWSEKWKGRTEAFRENPITGAAPNRSEEQLGSALFQAIGSAKSWAIDESRRKRLLSLCIDDWCSKTWASELFSGAIAVEVSNGGEAYPPAFRVQGYTARTLADLKIKLGHFPPDTTFRWCPQTFNPFDAYTPGERKAMYEDLSVFLSQRSISIEPESPKCASGSSQ